MSSYFRDRYQGVGAIAAAAPAPRSAPAPSVGTFAQDARWGDPMLNLPRRARLGPQKRVLAAGPGGTVLVRSASLTRPAVMMSGVRRGRAPMSGLGLDDQGAGMHTAPQRLKGRGAGLRAQVAGMKPAAYVPPVAQIGAFATYAPLTPMPTGAGMTTRTPKTQIFPAPPPRIGTGIGQQPGTVLTGVPSPYGSGVTAPTATIGGGVAISPVLEEYEPPIDVGLQSETVSVQTYPAPAPSSTLFSTRNLLLLGGGALALYLLTRKRKNR